MTGQLKWTCEACGKTIVAMQRGKHVRGGCSAQRVTTPPPAPLLCLCGCGEQAPLSTGRRPKRYVDGHYEAHRSAWRAKQAARDEVAKTVEEMKLAKEMAAVAARHAELQRSASAVRMITGEASFALWVKLLGLKTADAV